MPDKIVVIRPGALGDVLAARGALCWLKRRFPEYDLDLIAPGERGRVLLCPGWADLCRDWERAAFAWLFSDGINPPPEALAEVFHGSRLIVAYLSFGDEAMRTGFVSRLRTVAPEAGISLFPSAPSEGSGENIVGWLCRQARGAVKEWFGDGGCVCYPDPLPCQTARIPVEFADEVNVHAAWAGAGRYAVLHPGSGGVRKNWPLENFVFLGRKLFHSGFRVAVTAGPADDRLGDELAGQLPESVLLRDLNLRDLARILAGAGAYVGNDSGVSHLAASVMTPDGAYPVSLVIFGPTDSTVWAPPDSIVLEAGHDLRGIGAEEAWKALCRNLPT